jgi:ParB/RepB/Spo0J family partition protein
MADQQKSLYPQEAPILTNLLTDEVEDLIPELAECNEVPDKSFLDSVRDNGVLQSILVIRKRSGKKYDLAAGRRRIKAALATGQTYIPARVFPFGWTKKAVLTLIENEQRRRNIVAEWDAVNSLVEEGMSLDDLMAKTGLNQVRLDALLRLNTLPDSLQEAIRNREIKPGVAVLMAKQRKTTKTQLAKRFKERGKITAADVAEIREAVKKAAVASLPPSLFETVQEDWRQVAVLELDSVWLKIKDKATPDVIEKFEALLSAVERDAATPLETPTTT